MSMTEPTTKETSSPPSDKNHMNFQDVDMMTAVENQEKEEDKEESSSSSSTTSTVVPPHRDPRLLSRCSTTTTTTTVTTARSRTSSFSNSTCLDDESRGDGSSSCWKSRSGSNTTMELNSTSSSSSRFLPDFLIHEQQQEEDDTERNQAMVQQQEASEKNQLGIQQRQQQQQRSSSKQHKSIQRKRRDDNRADRHPHHRSSSTNRRMILSIRIARSAVVGGLLGGLLAVMLLLLLSILHYDGRNNSASRLTFLGGDRRTLPTPFACTLSSSSRRCATTTTTTTRVSFSSSPSSPSSFWMRRTTLRGYHRKSLFSNTVQGIYAYLDLFDAPWQRRHAIIQQGREGEQRVEGKAAAAAPTLSRRHRNLKDDNTAPTSSGSGSSSSTSSSSSSSGSSSSTSSYRPGGGTSTSSSKRGPTLVIAGKMTVEDAPCNIAQFDLASGDWSLSERIQLSLYNSYSGGEVYSLLANYTTSDLLPPEGGGLLADTTKSVLSGSSSAASTTTSSSSSSSGTSLIARKSPSSTTSSSSSSSLTPQTSGSGALIVVGAFDTTYRNSQVTYCSVGVWDGLQLSKVGEGLCNSALSKGMKITTAALAGPQDMFVAGSFQTQVWNGDRHEFVKIFNIAHFNAVDQVWLPLNVGQITCSWCTVTVLALAWDSKRRQLHVAGKFNSIDGRNVPAGLAIYDYDTGHLVAHPGGGLTMRNISQDGVGTALQLDEESGVLYVMGSFERLTASYEICLGLAAYEIEANRWTCLADAAHTVLPTGGGNMLLTPYGLMVGGKTTSSTTWPDSDRPYTIALLKATLQQRRRHADVNDDSVSGDDDGYSRNQTETKQEDQYHDFNWSWLPGFKGHDEPLHALSNGFGMYNGTVFIAGDNLVAKWHYVDKAEKEEIDKKALETASSIGTKSSTSTTSTSSSYSSTETTEYDYENSTLSPYEDYSNGEMGEESRRLLNTYAAKDNSPPSPPILVPTTEILSTGHVRGAIMAISQMMPEPDEEFPEEDVINLGQLGSVNITIIVYCVSAGCVIGVIGAILCNRNITSAIFPFLGQEKDLKGFTLDTLTYSALENTNIMDAYRRAMETRYVQHPHLLTIIDPQEIFLQRIIGEGTFGRVWSAKWRSASVAVKEFVFAQAAVAGRSAMQQEIVEEIIGEAGMMAILRHPNVLQLFGCSLTAQAIWIVSELCSLGSLRQLLDDNDKSLSVERRLSLALQVAEGMTYLHNQDPPIIHRDLKSHNIFVHETFTDAEDMSVTSDKQKKGKGLNDHYEKIESHSTMVAKIGDWGSARATLSGSRTMTHGVGTACWLAPEVIKHARSSKFSDVYGYGIVLWELATREEVYQGLETTQIIAKVANENLRPPIPQTCPWKDLMVRCWAENPMDRLEFSEIVAELTRLSKVVQEERIQSSDDGQSQTTSNDGGED